MALEPKAPPKNDQGRPYFLWSEDLNEAAFRQIIDGSEGSELRAIYIGRLLREARVAEVWYYLTPQEVADAWTLVAPHLGRMRDFWQSLLEAWSESHRISWRSELK